MDKNTALIAAGIIFSIVAFIHILRLYYKFEIIIAGKTISMEMSVLALVVAILLALWMFIASRS